MDRYQSNRNNRPMRGGARRRKPAEPVLMGEPSPALAKISRMNTEKLMAYIETLKVEDERLQVKVNNLTAMAERDEARIDELHKQRKRLEALMDAARERLAGKLERRIQRDNSDANPAPGPPVSRGYQSRGYRR